MTPKQIEALEHIFLFGSTELSRISGRALHSCFKKGWIDVDPLDPWVPGLPINDCLWVLTDQGREALHEATR